MGSQGRVLVTVILLLIQGFDTKKAKIKLFHEGSERLVQITPNLNINSNGIHGRNEATTIFYIENAEKQNKSIFGYHPKVRLRGGHKAKFLVCFNEKGSLIMRKARNIRNRRKCTFQEIKNEGFVMYRSMYNHRWYIGFDKFGKSLSFPYNNFCHNDPNFFKFVKKFIEVNKKSTDVTKVLCNRWTMLPKQFLHPLF